MPGPITTVLDFFSGTNEKEDNVLLSGRHLCLETLDDKRLTGGVPTGEPSAGAS